MTEHWSVYHADEPVRCPARLTVSRRCNRAQDRVAKGTTVRVRIQPDPHRALAGSLLRQCRACRTPLEIHVTSDE